MFSKTSINLAVVEFRMKSFASPSEIFAEPLLLFLLGIPSFSKFKVSLIYLFFSIIVGTPGRCIF